MHQMKVFTLLSIKTRIETELQFASVAEDAMFLLYYPLKQGLKPVRWDEFDGASLRVFTLLSIKTRIETTAVTPGMQK